VALPASFHIGPALGRLRLPLAPAVVSAIAHVAFFAVVILGASMWTDTRTKPVFVVLTPSVVVTCRPIGVLMMDDEAGGDAKLLAVPIDKILPIYTHWQKPEDINPMRLNAITHFFEHYKDLEPGKWVKVKGWKGPDAAKAEIVAGIAAYAKTK